MLQILALSSDGERSNLRRPVIGAFGPFEYPLADRYRFDSILGRGAMGRVYLATDSRLGRQVAIKILHAQLTSEIGIKRFQSEIRICAGLHHPNIMTVHDCGEVDGRLYYVMEYLGGESLRARLEREQQLSVADAVGITEQVAAGLQYAHARGVVHRDIKPENIILADGRVCIVDFGLARIVNDAGSHSLTESGFIVGTPMYLSPEQASAEKHIGPGSDQYALACVLFELLVGEPPFLAPTPTAIAIRHLKDTPPLLHSRRRDAPSGVGTAVERALRKLPGDRFATVRDFAAAASAASRAAPEDWREPRQTPPVKPRPATPPPAVRANERAHRTAFRTATGNATPVHSAGELAEQLRRRLRVKSAIWAAASGVLGATGSLAHWDHISANPRTMITEPPLPGLLFLITAGTLALIWVLSPHHNLGVKRLRAIEWLGVSVTATFFLLNQMLALPGMLPEIASVPMELGAGNGAPWGALIIAYGVLIPSSLRHGALRTSILVTCAFVPDVIVFTGVGAVPGMASYLALKLITTTAMSALALYGAYRIDVLGQNVYEARQLGQYLLRHQLGKGGMGEVYLAEHQFLRRPCAVKLIRPEQAGDEATLARFEREVQAASGLTHPNTVQIYDYGHDEAGTFYFAMEYLPGVSLEELVNRHGPLPPARAVRVLTQLCGALSEAHDAGLVHRDLKPGNVMLCERGGAHDVAKLLDFGLVARVHADGETDDPKLTQTGRIMGTPAFMSPEQCGGDCEVTAKSDLYGMGALAYYLLTGAAPFAGRSGLKMLAAHLYEAPRPITELRADVPPRLAAIIARCLEKDPAERFVDARALERAFAASVSGEEWTETHAREWWQMRQQPALAMS